jgi:signal transduction histidine kinase
VGLLLSILLAGVASFAAATLLRPADAEIVPMRLTAQNIQARLEERWTDPARADEYIADLRKTTGLDIVLLRDVNNLPRAARRARRREVITFEPGGHAYIPISSKGELVALVELRLPPPGPPMGRPYLPLAVAVLVLGAAAFLLSKRLTRPLDAIAEAARRFGSGDLAARVFAPEADAREDWERAAPADVKSVALAFDEMAGRIEQVVTDQRSLLFAISHELRSPLARARISLEILRDQAPTPQPQIDRLERELGNIDGILQDLLATARTGLSDLRPEPTEVAPWLEEALADEGEVRLELEALTEKPARLSFDRALVKRAIINLVHNAFKYGAAPVVVRAEHAGDAVRFAVEDAGAGFDATLLPKVFEPFVRGDKARTPVAARDREGVGLGLTLVRRIAEAHGGSSVAENFEGGARVSFTVKDLAAVTQAT